MWGGVRWYRVWVELSKKLQSSVRATLSSTDKATNKRKAREMRARERREMDRRVRIQ